MPSTLSPRRRGSRPKGPGSPPPSSSSKGTLAAAAVAAVAAGTLGVAALHGGSSKPKAPAPAPATAKVVAVARAIPRGTVLTGLGADTLRVQDVPVAKVPVGALTSVGAVKGKVAAADLKPGTTLTAASVTADGGAVTTRLTAGQRAITIPLDAAHGMAGDIRVADRVDLYGSFRVTSKADPTERPVLKPIAEDVRVLRAPVVAKGSTGGATAQSQITVALGPKAASEAAFAADNGKVWVAARAPGAGTSPPSLVTTESLLFDVAPIVQVDSPKEPKR